MMKAPALFRRPPEAEAEGAGGGAPAAGEEVSYHVICDEHEMNMEPVYS